MSTWSGSVKKLKYSRLKTLLKTLVLSVSLDNVRTKGNWGTRRSGAGPSRKTKIVMLDAAAKLVDAEQTTPTTTEMTTTNATALCLLLLDHGLLESKQYAWNVDDRQ